MKSVFIGGSRKVSRLNEQIRTKLADVIGRDFHVLIGDANGADRAVQAQLRDWHYPHVTVFFVGEHPRNNEGGWPTERVQPPPAARGAEFYGAKDLVMAQLAEAGLMLWDGESKGTLANVKNLLRFQKPVSVYLSRTRRFKSFLSETDLQLAMGNAQQQDDPPEQPELNLGVASKGRAKRRKRAL